MLITFPYLVRTIIASLSRIDPLAEEAARTPGCECASSRSGTSPCRRCCPGLVAGMLFAFIVSFDNVSISLFLASARTTDAAAFDPQLRRDQLSIRPSPLFPHFS